MDRENKEIKNDEVRREKKVTQMLFDIANAVNTTSSLDDLYGAIHHSLDRVMDATNFFIAIVDAAKKKIYFPYYVDVEDNDFEPKIDFDTNDSLTGLVVQKGEPLLLKEEVLSKRSSKNGVWGPVPVIWMGVPLKVRHQIIGVIAVQNYTDPQCYTKKDLSLLASVSDHIVVAIERKQAQEKLLKSEERYRTLFEKSKDAILIIKNQIFIDCNPATVDMLGYKNKEQLLETHPSELSPKTQSDGRNSFNKVVEMIEIALEKGSHRFEWDHIRANGEVFPVEVLLTAISTEKGNQVIHTTWRDITERKLAEEKLETTEDKFTKLFQATPCWSMLSMVDDGTIIEANDMFFKNSGYDRQEVIGHTGFDFGLYLNPDGRKKVLNEFYRKGRLKDYPIQFRMKNGKIRDYLWSAETIDIDDTLCWVSVILDITDRKLAEKERIRVNLLAAEQEKHALVGQVAGKMAHDFNNLLGVIMGNAEIALLDCSDEQIKETLELIYGQTIRGKNLTKNLTAFAKTQEPKYEFFKLNDVIDLVINLLKKDLEGIELIKEFVPDLPDLIADQGMIEHALLNLMQNSIHALSKVQNPKIIIKTSYQGDLISFEIEDNGCGIPQENILDIFEPSFTLKGSNDLTSSYSKDIKGTGYGMSNVKKYIEQHQGVILVKSAVNIGTTFFIRLPIIKKELSKLEKIELVELQLITRKDILLVEDESAISDVQYRILTREPCFHKVDLARNGQMAIELFKKNKYDLVSLDYQLPGKINGMDVYKRIKAIDESTPILFISGNLEFLESINKLKQHQNIDYLSKPCQNKVYVNAINQLLKNKDVIE
ncbi:MAG: PAS domain S-box protein [Desulfobacteraceae bacterium]|nr:PAS domain S-box protein [Desulfobacteraceae bacterium]